jgi:excisionase family DNA binding protein
MKQFLGDIFDVATLGMYLGISAVTIYRLLVKKEKNGFPGYKVKGQWRFFKTDIDKWVRENSR